MKKPVRTASAALAILIAAGTATALTTSSASADVTPVTGGTTTLSIPFNAAFGQRSAGLYELPTGPASLSYDPTADAVNYTLPVTGGDASVNTFYGTLTHGGGLVVLNRHNHTGVNLTNITFNIEDDTISATASTLAAPTKTTQLVLFDAVGNHDLAVGPPETFSASDLQLDKAAAKYLDRNLHIWALKGGAHVGSFATSFTNTND